MSEILTLRLQKSMSASNPSRAIASCLMTPRSNHTNYLIKKRKTWVVLALALATATNVERLKTLRTPQLLSINMVLKAYSKKTINV